MIDFDALVLNPLENIFAVRVRVYPEATRPGASSYERRGVFTSNPVDVMLEAEQTFSDQRTTLGIRIADFANLPDRGDLVEILEGPYKGNRYWIDDQDEDGEGGITLALRKDAP